MLSIKVELLRRFNRLVFAISGGKDSMALLHFAKNNLNPDNFSVITIHHNLRGAEGERDRDFVKDYCSKNNIDCIVYEEQIKKFCEDNGYTIEQGARIRRREIFKEIVSSGQAERVVTAHQKDDQVESILMHIFRGTGIKGLCGMPEDDGIIIRPMLDCSGDEIKDYLKDNNIPFVQDSTNQDLDYTRNMVRNLIIPDIKKAYDGAGENILRLSEISKKMQEYLDNNTPKAEMTIDGAYLSIEDIKARDIIASQAVINAVDKVSTRVDLEKGHIEAIFDLIDKENGAQVYLPFDTVAIKEYEKILFTKAKLMDIEEQELRLGDIYTGEWKINVSDKDNGGLRMDKSMLEGAKIVKRQPGMMFKRYKGGTKSLGDYLTDIKVPKRIRDYLPIIVKNRDVCAVLPYEIADFVAINDKTKEIIYIKAERV